MLASGGGDRAVRLWPIPQVATGSTRGLRDRVQRLTALELRPDNVLRPLSAAAWLQIDAAAADATSAAR